MKSIGIVVNEDESLLLALEAIVDKTDYILRKDSYYYMVYDFMDVPSEDRNIWINNNDWFKKSVITSDFLRRIIGNFNEMDGIEEEPVQDFLVLLQEVHKESLEIKIFKID